MPRKKLPPLRPLTEQQKKAVQLTYEGMLSVQEIANALGVHRSTVWRWKQMREFWYDWHRIDRNERRKWERRNMKRIALDDAYWEEQIRITKENLDRESEKINKRPGKEWNAAYNAYMRAQLHGFSLADVIRFLNDGECKPGRRRRHK